MVSLSLSLVVGERNTFASVMRASSDCPFKQAQHVLTTGGPSSVSELVAGDAARVTIPVPPGTAFLLLNGTVGSDRGEALITWKPAPPNFPLKGWSFNMSSLWNAPALLYATQLDPDVVYNVTIEALSNEMYNVTDIGLHTLTYYSGWSQEWVVSLGLS